MGAPSSDRAAMRQVVRALRKADHVITGGHNGEEGFTSEIYTSEDDILDELTSCDSSNLYVTLPDGDTGWIYFVLGNDPEEVVCDYTTNLGDVLDPLTRSWWA